MKAFSTKNIILQERDDLILKGLGKYRFLTTNHIQIMYFPNNKSKTSFARRLRGLVENSYIDFVPSYDKKTRTKSVNCYFLTKKGFEYLIYNFDFDGYFYRKTKDITDLLFFDHTISCIDFRMKAEKDIENHDRALIEKWITQFDVKNPGATSKKDRIKLSYQLYDKLKRESKLLYPDDQFILKGKNSDGRMTYFVEIDKGTESNTNKIRDKIRKYELLFSDIAFSKTYTDKNSRLLFITTSPKRAVNILNVIKDDELLKNTLGKLFLSDFQQTQINNIFTSPIWLKSDGEIVSLIKQPTYIPNIKKKSS
jgi:hypothetical protein